MLDYKPRKDLLADRVVMITGAGDGIGRAAALSFADHGATVIALGRTAAKLESLDEAIGATGSQRPYVVVQDLAKCTQSTCEQLATEIEKEFGRLDGLLHNAAQLGTMSPLHLYELEAWSVVMRVNLYLPYLLTRSCLQLLKESEDASVIFTTAAVARRARAYWGAYAVAGFGVEGMMQVWADELDANTHIRVNTLDPGPVKTGLQMRAYPGKDPTGLLAPEQIMPAYLYLMGPDSCGVSGRAFSAQTGAEPNCGADT